MQEYLTIGEAAKRVGLRPKTIRYYEEIGLIPAPSILRFSNDPCDAA